MKTTSLNQTHRSQGAKMVEFAGYDMPVQYSSQQMSDNLHFSQFALHDQIWSNSFLEVYASLQGSHHTAKRFQK